MNYDPEWSLQRIEKLINKTEIKLAKEYKQAAKNVKSQIADLYERYGKEGQLTYQEMSKYNRLNTLYKSVQEELNTSFNVVVKDIKNLVATEFEESYYMNGFLLSKELEINLSFGLIPKETIRALINEPNVSGASLIETLGKTRYNLLLKERQTMVQGFINGLSYNDMAKNISDEFNKSFNDALRIARTEGTRAANYGQLECYNEAEDMGVEIEKVWVATLGPVGYGKGMTRPSHADLDGQAADEEGYFTIKTGDNAGARAECPGDFGIAEEDISCRCGVRAQLKDRAPKVRRENVGDKDIIEYKTYKQWKADQQVA